MTSNVVVSIFSPVCLASAALRDRVPPNARDGRRRFGALAVRITPTPTGRLPIVPARVCSLLNKHSTLASSSAGHLLRGELCPVLGWAIVVAGWFRDPSEVGTTASSFRTLAAQPGGLGRWLLGVTAAGFVAYGFYRDHPRALSPHPTRPVRPHL